MGYCHRNPHLYATRACEVWAVRKRIWALSMTKTRLCSQLERDWQQHVSLLMLLGDRRVVSILGGLLKKHQEQLYTPFTEKNKLNALQLVFVELNSCRHEIIYGRGSVGRGREVVRAQPRDRRKVHDTNSDSTMCRNLSQLFYPIMYLGPARQVHGLSFREVTAKKPSLKHNLGTNGLKVTSEPLPQPGRRAACKDRIAQRSPIRAGATLDVA
ncbi:hypothetical protein J6590_034476 [Homalodisca vitripennis]|nr:hypothetical protein J6590_034476 [Homalodisca vitripennis]